MEQKAVTYKTIKGMARDMAMSSGSNDFSYENYNIRITTRGKEDSLIVTNEKGTESNIIASRNVTKTINTVFQGKKPDFYHSMASINSADRFNYPYTELYKAVEPILHDPVEEESDYGKFVSVTEEEYITGKLDNSYTSIGTKTQEEFDARTEDWFKQETEEEETIYVKVTSYVSDTIFYIKTNITFYRQDLSKQDAILSNSNDDITFGYNTEYPVANENSNNELKIKGTFTLNEKPIEYMGESLYLIDNGVYTKDINVSIPAGYNNVLHRISVKEIALNGYSDEYSDYDKWMDSYKYLYDKITNREFDFFGFTTNIPLYSNTSAIKLEKIYQSVNNIGNKVIYPIGKYKKDEYYANNILVEEQTNEDGSVPHNDSSTNVYRVKSQSTRLGFINGYMLSNMYSYGTALTIKTNPTCSIRWVVVRKIESTDTLTSSDRVYEKYANSSLKFVNTGDNIDSSKKTNYYKQVGYFTISFDFDILEYCKSLPDIGYKKIISNDIVVTGAIAGYSNGQTVNDLQCQLECNKSVLTISMQPKNGNNWKYEKEDINNNGFYNFLTKKDNNIDYIISSGGGPFYLSYNSVENIDSFSSNIVPDLIVGFNLKICNTYNNAEIIKYEFNNNVYKFKDFDVNGQKASYKTVYYLDGSIKTARAATNDYIKTTDGIKFLVKESSSFSGNYCCIKYEFLNASNSYYNISSITSVYNSDTEFINIELATNNHILSYNVKNYTILDNYSSTTFYLYKITSDNFSFPFIAYIEGEIGEGYSNGKDVYTFNNGSFSKLESFDYIVKSDLSGASKPCDDPSSGNYFKIYKDNDVLKFGTSISGTIHNFIGNVIIEKLTELPISQNPEYEFVTIDVENSDVFDLIKNKLYIKNNDQYTQEGITDYSDQETYYIQQEITTSINSRYKELYENPRYNTVVNNSLFKFKQSDFTSTFETGEKSFKVKYSNSDWDNKYIYQMLDSVDDNADYIKDDVYPYYHLDTSALVLDETQPTGTFKIIKSSSEDVYFEESSTSTIYVTIKDSKDKSYSKKDTLDNFIDGVTDSELIGDLKDAHEFYIAEINSYENEPSGLYVDDIDQEVINNFYSKEDEEKYKDKIKYQIMSYSETVNETTVKHLFVRQTLNKTVSTIEYDFKNTYKNKFYSPVDFSVLVSNYGEYSSLTIPGRVLGSCTIDDYVVLFFHYSSPALKFYEKVDDSYIYVDPNSVKNKSKLYTKRRGEDVYDLAVENNILLRDDNNDYINGKNKDYIVRLKYIDARPDNKENEWVTIVNKIANAATQVNLETPIVEKKPYYAAEILWSGDLRFNANNGIETIGYYESKDVIKTYWTDGKNQPRMINIMTPRSQRTGGDMKYAWDNKTFDFIQEISGSEKFNIKKQYGGGAFPAGTVQYYFTYSNLGGCETNPFVCSPIYYTSQSDKGNSPVKITDNTFKITLYNLSTRFDYVNIYSVVRTSKDTQPICKRVINVSMKNNNKKITFTDNNLLGEIVDSSYLLMLQGTPISALTMAEKDNTLFLGNINKLYESLSVDEKEELKNCFDITTETRKYQDYNPNEEEWYENVVEDVKQYDIEGNLIKDDNGNPILKPIISLEKNSNDIKTFMYNEYYRLGIQLQDKFGKWTDPIFIKDVQCDATILNRIKYVESQEDGEKNVERLQSFIPYFNMKINNKSINKFNQIINKHEYKKIRPVIVYPNISSRNVLCQGLLSPTMFNYADRSINGPFNFASYYFRPYPPAYSENKDESGNYVFDIDVDIAKVGGYPIEYRHGFPITGYHDAIEESLAEGEQISGDNSVANIVSNYFSKRNTTFVKLNSNTPGWYLGGAKYLRQGTVNLTGIQDNNLIGTYSGDVYEVTSKTNKGHINKIGNYSDNITSSKTFSTSKFFDTCKSLFNIQDDPVYRDTLRGFGFASHIHYFKNSFLQIGSAFTGGSIVDAALGYPTKEIVTGTGHTECGVDNEGLIFNEQGVYYKAHFPVTIKFIPLGTIRKEKHRGLKRKTYYCDIVVSSDNIELSSSNNGDKYIDDGGFESDVAKKAYFAYNNGEIACANGNKNYNIYKGSVISKVDDTYSSSEINVSARKQSLFYVDESICTLNSPEIEYNPTVQKIDLSTYKLNIIGAANITGYKNNIQIDTETPPAAFGTIVGQGFRHEPFEVQNFNTEAYRYMLSGAYWYDSFFAEGTDEEGEKPCEDASFLSDQFCWWVYPFNRQILNNSKEGQYGKLRTKKWVNYHYSAFSDFFGSSSILYELKDAQQIYDVHQTVNLDTVWQKDKATYFGSCDTAYTNPVPLVGVLGGSNEPEENAYEQSLAVSPHCGFKASDKTYSSANLADIVPFSFASSNHFVLSLNQYSERKSNVFPKFYTDESLLQDIRKHTIIIPFEEKYELYINDDYFYSTENPVQFLGITKTEEIVLWNENEDNFIILRKDFSVLDGKYYSIKVNENVYVWGTDVIPSLVDEGSGENSYVIINDETNEVEEIVFKKDTILKQEYEELYNDFQDHGNEKTLEKEYNIPSSLIIDSTKPTSCIERYIQYNDISNDNIKQTGIYDYGHVYIAQLERNVKSADDVFSGTEESVLLQNTWIPAGQSIMISEFKTNGLKYTEGDAYYQRYDCMKTYAHTGSDINQNIEVLSAMIQTRINLDGVYSYKGTVDNVDMNNSNTNLLNDSYSQSDNYFTYSITNSYISAITEYSNMFTWTLTKQPMSTTDNWMAINLIAYYNATGSFGKITRIINYRNNLFCFQDNAISQIAYNERVALTPSDGVPIEIGNSGKVQGLNYISSNVGCQNRWSVCPSKGYLYWVDDRRAEIYRFSDSLEPFSTINGFSDWVKANTYGEDWKPIKSTNVPITTYYDNNNDDIYFVTEKDCLAYNEKLNAFESFFSYEDSFILNSAGNTIVIKEQDAVIKENSDIYSGDAWWNNGIRGDGLSSIELMHEGDYNRFFGVQMPFYMRFKVYPSDLQRDKIFTNLEFNLDAFDEKDLYLPDETITKVKIWNEYQWGQWKIGDPLYSTTAYKKRFRTHYLQLPRASYYPTDYYENFNTMFYREPMWKVWNNSIAGNNVLSYINASSVNDRIRNPWTWLEIYKSNGTDSNDFKEFEIIGSSFEDRQQYYLNNKNKLFIQKYVQISKDEWDNYQELYKIVNHEYVKEANNGSDRNPDVIAVGLEVGYLKIDVTEKKFKELKDSLYIKVENVYTQEGITDFDKNQTYYLKEDVRSNYNLSELYYQKQDGTYDNASQDMYDNEDITLYKLSFNELYALNYINCANIFKFADDVTYYELKKSNCRVEIHDIILKYFEA